MIVRVFRDFGRIIAILHELIWGKLFIRMGALEARRKKSHF